MHEGIFIISAHSKYSLEKYVRAMHNYVSELLENNKMCSGSYDNKNVENDIFRIIGNIVGVETSDLSLDTELDELSLDSYLIKLLCEELRKNFSKDISVDYISYIEAHGTATMIGDPIELKALTRTFSNYTDKKQFCGIGSVKTNIGHLLSAAGISAFIKTALCIYHKELVPTLNCTVPNPRFDFKNSPFFPVLSAVPWRTENGRLYAGISSFGFGGTNAHIVLSNFDEKSHNEYKCIRERKPKSIFDKKRYFIDDTSKNGILIQKDKTDLPKRELSILNLID